MADYGLVFGAGANDVFAGVPVSDFRIALDWYQRLFGCAPAFFPNDREAVWALGELRWLYIIVEPERAGGSIQTIMCKDLEAAIEAAAVRGITCSKEERPAENVRKVMYYDPDGNEIGLGRIPS